jgi:broad specificity phosphatase PhoE
MSGGGHKQGTEMTVSAFPGSRIYLIRHGQTEWSLSGRHTGRTDIPLTTEGEAQARGLAALLHGLRFDRVLTSPRQRARQTCVLAGLGDQAEIEPDLAEWDYGEYEGRRSAEIHAHDPCWNVFKNGCPGGETPRAVADRADRLLARLAQGNGTTALFSHGHFGSALGARWIALDIRMAQHFWLDTASLSILAHHPSRPQTRILARWNMVARASA